MPYKSILVPVDGSSADQQAVEMACRLAKKPRSKVYVIYVIQMSRALPLDAALGSEAAKGEAALSRAERTADEEEYEIETELLQAREVGPAVVEEAVEREVDLIVMGLSYRKRFGQFTLGEAIPYVLKNAPCRVLISREAIAVPEKT